MPENIRAHASDKRIENTTLLTRTKIFGKKYAVRSDSVRAEYRTMSRFPRVFHRKGLPVCRDFGMEVLHAKGRAAERVIPAARNRDRHPSSRRDG